MTPTTPELTKYLQSFQPGEKLYGEALLALARIGSLEWIESIKGTTEYTAQVQTREAKSRSELQSLLALLIPDNIDS